MQKIFITGVAGFLGSHLADKFLELGYQVAGNDILIGGYLTNVNSAVEFYNVDCCDFDAMKNAVAGSDIVIHAAATAYEGLSVFSPSFVTRNIFEATSTTISAAIANKVKRFVFCSSMARYGNQPGPFTEDMQKQPVDPYGIAKAAAEDLLVNLATVHGMEWNIAVPHNIVGPRQKYDDPYRNVMSIMINRNLRQLPALIYGDGEQKRCFSYIDDCIYCLVQLATDRNISSEIVNIGPDEEFITINRLAELVAIETGMTEEFIYMPSRPQEVKIAVCSSDKARKLLGYKTSTSLKAAIRKTVNWIEETGPQEFDYRLPIEIDTPLTPMTWKNKLI